MLVWGHLGYNGTETQRNTTMALYAVIWSYTDDATVIDASRAAHGAYIKQLAGDGNLKEAGAWTDGSGALLIFDVPDEAALRTILDADPYVAGGVVSAESINAWSPALGRFTS